MNLCFISSAIFVVKILCKFFLQILYVKSKVDPFNKKRRNYIITGKEKKDGKKGNKDGDQGSSTTSKPAEQQSKSSKLLNQLFGKSSDKIAESPAIERKAFEKRRTIGATTIPLDPRNFSNKPTKAKHPQDVSTGDMWRTLKPISSGISGAEERVSDAAIVLSPYCLFKKIIH